MHGEVVGKSVPLEDPSKRGLDAVVLEDAAWEIAQGRGKLVRPSQNPAVPPEQPSAVLVGRMSKEINHRPAKILLQQAVGQDEAEKEVRDEVEAIP